MTEGQPPRQTAASGLDPGAGVTIEQLDALEQVAGGASNGCFHRGAVDSLRHEQGEIEFGGRSHRKRAESFHGSGRAVRRSPRSLTWRSDWVRREDRE